MAGQRLDQFLDRLEADLEEDDSDGFDEAASLLAGLRAQRIAMSVRRNALRAMAAGLLAVAVTVLVLTVARVVWRLLNDPPPYPAGMKSWERHTAHFAHFLLYAAMVLMPLSGWAILSAHSPPGSRGAVVEFATPPTLRPGMKPGSYWSGQPRSALATESMVQSSSATADSAGVQPV